MNPLLIPVLLLILAALFALLGLQLNHIGEIPIESMLTAAELRSV